MHVLIYAESVPWTALHSSIGESWLGLPLALRFVKVFAGSLNHSEVYLIFLLLNLKLGYFSWHIIIHIQIKSVKPSKNIKVVTSNMQSQKHVKSFLLKCTGTIKKQHILYIMITYALLHELLSLSIMPYYVKYVSKAFLTDL